MGKVLRVFDLDDTLVKTSSNIKVTHKDGKETVLTPGEYAVYKPKGGDKFDYSDFNRMLKNPKIIKKNVDLLIRMLSNPNKKVTILTARQLVFPIRYYFKKEFGLDVYPVALGDADPQKKADWIEKHIERGYTDIAFMDDSPANVRAIDALKVKYPHINLRTKLVVDNFVPTEKVRIFESVMRKSFNKMLNKIN
jgi:hypothetical protein